MKKTEMMTKLVVILALTTLVQVALADTSTKTKFTFSKFVKDLTEKSRRKRSPGESESDEPPLYHPEIRYNVLREISRGPRANIENNLPPKPHVPCGDCQVRSMWVTIKRPSCKSVKIRVPACQGLCTSWEIPHYDPPYVKRHHPVCRPSKTEFRRVHLPHCDDENVNNVVIIAIPTKCECGVCDTNTTNCRPLY